MLNNVCTRIQHYIACARYSPVRLDATVTNIYLEDLFKSIFQLAYSCGKYDNELSKIFTPLSNNITHAMKNVTMAYQNLRKNDRILRSAFWLRIICDDGYYDITHKKSNINLARS